MSFQSSERKKKEMSEAGSRREREATKELNPRSRVGQTTLRFLYACAFPAGSGGYLPPYNYDETSQIQKQNIRMNKLVINESAFNAYFSTTQGLIGIYPKRDPGTIIHYGIASAALIGVFGNIPTPIFNAIQDHTTFPINTQVRLAYNQVVPYSTTNNSDFVDISNPLAGSFTFGRTTQGVYQLLSQTTSTTSTAISGSCTVSVVNDPRILSQTLLSSGTSTSYDVAGMVQSAVNDLEGIEDILLETGTCTVLGPDISSEMGIISAQLATDIKSQTFWFSVPGGVVVNALSGSGGFGTPYTFAGGLFSPWGLQFGSGAGGQPNPPTAMDGGAAILNYGTPTPVPEFEWCNFSGQVTLVLSSNTGNDRSYQLTAYATHWFTACTTASATNVQNITWTGITDRYPMGVVGVTIGGATYTQNFRFTLNDKMTDPNNSFGNIGKYQGTLLYWGLEVINIGSGNDAGLRLNFSGIRVGMESPHANMQSWLLAHLIRYDTVGAGQQLLFKGEQYVQCVPNSVVNQQTTSQMAMDRVALSENALQLMARIFQTGSATGSRPGFSGLKRNWVLSEYEALKAENKYGFSKSLLEFLSNDPTIEAIMSLAEVHAGNIGNILQAALPVVGPLLHAFGVADGSYMGRADGMWGAMGHASGRLGDLQDYGDGTRMTNSARRQMWADQRDNEALERMMSTSNMQRLRTRL